MFDIGSQDDFVFTTTTLNFSIIKGSRILSKQKIYPSWSFLWNYKILSIFLNQLKDFEPMSESPTRKSQSDKQNYRYFRFYHTILGKEHIILIKIYTDRNFLIEVLASITLLTSGFFTEIEENKIKYKYFLKFPELNHTSSAILNSEPLAFFNLTDFNSPFIYFSRTITRSLINNCHTCFLFQFAKIFFKRSISEPVTSLKQLAFKTRGYLKIITANTNYKNLFQLDGNTNSYVIRGCYISPYAKSILENNSSIIDGLMFDGTFKILKNYVTCIIMAISHNTSIPVGFTFSPFEDEFLYDNIFQTFLEILGLDISNFVIESDQGKHLINICKKYNCKHLCCLRHLLANLNKKKYGFEVSRLVSCKCSKDFKILCDEFNRLFKDKSDSQKENFDQTLNYVGLTFSSNEISVMSPDRWEEVSIINRKKFRMPTTTNSLESVHGHLNEATPRNNLFFPSIFRLIMAINSQTKQFVSKVHHNFRKIINDVKKQKSKDPFLSSKCENYQTTLEKCECGETDLYSEMFRCDIPCVHRHFLGKEFPQMPEIELNLIKQFNELILDIQEANYMRKNMEYDYVIDIIVKTIKRYSHSKHTKEEIKQHVVENYNPEYKTFVQGYPIEFFSTISNGIDIFSE